MNWYVCCGESSLDSKSGLVLFLRQNLVDTISSHLTLQILIHVLKYVFLHRFTKEKAIPETFFCQRSYPT